MKWKERIFKFFTGIEPNNSSSNFGIGVKSCDGLEDNYLFDFLNFQSQYNGNVNFNVINANLVEGMNDSKLPQKIKVKPIDVLNELEVVPSPFTLTLLDEKIEILKDKAKLIHQHYAKRELEALIERIENRKKYNEAKTFFDRFQNTTDEKIDILLKKYDLVLKTSDIFIPEFPDTAITIMKEYTAKMIEICGKKPIFYVIATDDSFQEKYKQRDPILLVQSPFGFYWQILGAWDKEMLILSEL